MATDVRLGLEITDQGSSAKVEEAINEIKERLKESRKETRLLGRDLKSLQDIQSKRQSTTSSNRALEAAQLGVLARQRGSAELTGAAARDFSNQAQGLGGLVRLYATFAANVFALGAAFRSLRNAMDTTNMVRGLDELGAAAGKNLGGLSKRIAELSGGAISLAEAMKAVAQTSTGGLSAKNIERLAVVARTASAALGVSMPDAINRLSRGITKLEPELLDELGIMTRIEPAVELYARQVGKAASQLTVFERRQAFANAVLAEGEEKFGAISGLVVNPYDKFVSSLKDVIQVGSDAVNRVLAPILNILSESPSALGAGIAALAGLLIKQALPAVGEFKQGLAIAAKEAADISIKRAKDAASAIEAIDIELTNQLKASTKVKEQETFKQQDALEALISKRKKGILEESSLNRLIRKDIEDVTKADVKRAEAAARRLDRKGLKEQAVQVRLLAESVDRERISFEKLTEAKKNNQKFLDNINNKSTVLGATSALALEAQNTATKKLIISNAAYNGSLIGVTGSWKLLNLEIAKSGLQLTAFQRTMLVARGGLALFGGAVSTVVGAFAKLNNVIGILGTITALYGILEFFFASNAKEAANFSSAIDNVESSIDNMKRTLDNLDKNSTQGTIKGINALAEAFDNLTNSAEEALDAAAKKQQATTSIYSKVVESLLSVVGLDTDTKLTEGLVGIIDQALENLTRAGLKEKAEEVFKDILQVNILDTQSIEQAVGRLSKSAQLSLVRNLREVSTNLSNSASRLDTFKTATDNATLAYQQFIQTTSNNDPVFRVGAALENVAVTMHTISQEAMDTTSEINAVILELGKTPEAGVLFGDAFVSGLLSIREEFEEQEKQLMSYRKELSELEKQIANTPVNEVFSSSLNGVLTRDLEQERKNFTTLEKRLKDRKELEDKITGISETRAKAARDLFVGALDNAFKTGAELIRVSLGQAAEKGAIAISRAALAGLTGEDRARAETEISKKEIEIRLRAIDVNVDLILSQEKLKSAIEQNTAAVQLADARKAGKSTEQIRQLEQALEVSRVFSEVLNSSSNPTFDNAINFTDDEDIAKQVKIRGISTSQRLAEQEQAKILAQRELQALSISGEISARVGRLEDTQKLLGLEGQLTQAMAARVNTVRQLVGLNTEASVIAQSEFNVNNLKNKQSAELLAINTAISIAQSDSERKKQEEFKTLILIRQENERNVQQLQISQQLINARLEAMQRVVEVAKQVNQEQFNADSKRLELANAETLAYSQLFNITGEFTASQIESIGNQKAQIEFIKSATEVTIDFAQKAASLNERISALDPIADADEIKSLTEEFTRQETLAKSRLAISTKTLTTQQSILKVNKEVAILQARYNRLLSSASSITTNLSSSFGSMGSAIGSLSEAFSNLVVTSSQGAEAIKKMRQEQQLLTHDKDLYNKKENEIAIQLDQNTRTQLAGYGQLAGAAKSLFEEQSAGYQALLAVERVFHLAHLGMTLARMALDATATTASVANSGTRAAASVAEAEVSGVTAVVKALASMPFPLNVAAGAAVAAIVAALISSIGGSGPKQISTPGGFTSEDLQKTNGTGSTFIDGKQVDRSGGLLGNSTETLNDISTSLDLVEKYTSITSSFGMGTLNVLKKIEQNTKDLAGALFGSTNIGKLTSGFGTVEKVAPPKATGLLSSFIPSTSKSVEIVDKGIEVIGQFRDIIEQTAQFLEFETVKITKVKSGFLGIGAKTKIRFETNTKELGNEAAEVITELFTNLANSALLASKVVFGSASNNIQQVLDDFVVQFKVSGFGMSSAEFAEAILNESNVILNQVLEKAFPQLDEFRQLGEGFSATLLRLATTIDIVDSQFNKFNTSLDAVTQAAPDNVLGFTTALVEAFGGLEEFTDQTNFLFENFLSDEERIQIQTKQLFTAFNDLGGQGVLTSEQVSALVDGLGDLRLEYREVIAAQDLLTESGRNAVTILSALAPAVVEITEAIEDAKNSLKELKDSFKESIQSIVEDASLGNLEAEDIGDQVAETLRVGFLNALSSSFVDEITTSIVEELITPVLTGSLQLTTTGGLILTTSVNAIVDDMIAKANLLNEVLSNPSLKQALSILSISITQVVRTINENAKSLNFAFSKLRAAELLDEINELSKEIETRRLDDIIDSEQKRYDLLKDQADELEDSVQRFRDFSNSLRDFKQSLLTGQLSPLTPLEQLAESRLELTRLFQTAIAPNTSDDDRVAALDKIQEASTTFLEASRLVYSSGPQFTDNFNFVQNILDSVIGSTSSRASIDQMQLDSINAQLTVSESILENAKSQKDLLANIDDSIESLIEKLKDLNKDLASEYVKGNDQITNGFSILDRNFDGLLTLDELAASGMASDETLQTLIDNVDSNGDGQISRLEAIKSASEGTVNTIQSVIPILDAINSGIISVSAGIQQLDLINSANNSVGAGPVTGDIPAPSTGGAGLQSGSILQSSAYMVGGQILGLNNLRISIQDAKSAILQIASQVDANLRPASELYTLFKTWGASSDLVGRIVGSTASEVLQWFRLRDPSIPSFDQGINNVPYDMIAQIHKGERIFPKADNDFLMNNMQISVDINRSILDEIRKLILQIQKLELTVFEGDKINAEATSANADKVSNTMKEISELKNHLDKLNDKVSRFK